MVQSQNVRWSLKNIVLQGRDLRYIVRSVRNVRAAAGRRLVLVAGKRNGRMRGIKIDSESKIYASDDSTDRYHRFVVNVSGVSKSGERELWQLAAPTEKIQQQWIKALLESRDSHKSDELNGRTELLRNIAKKMAQGLSSRTRVGRFRIVKRCFLGQVAVKWFMKEYQCSRAQALQIGNRLVSAGLVEHVKHEHFFLDQKHYYRFHSISGIGEGEDDTEPWQDSFDLLHKDNTSIRRTYLKLTARIEDISNELVSAKKKSSVSISLSVGTLVAIGIIDMERIFARYNLSEDLSGQLPVLKMFVYISTILVAMFLLLKADTTSPAPILSECDEDDGASDDEMSDNEGRDEDDEDDYNDDEEEETFSGGETCDAAEAVSAEF